MQRCTLLCMSAEAYNWSSFISSRSTWIWFEYTLKQNMNAGYGSCWWNDNTREVFRMFLNAMFRTYTCICCPHEEQWRSQNAEKVTHINGRLLYQELILYNHVPFQIGTSLKGKNLLPEGANSFLYEQFLVVWEITFNTLGKLPRVLLFLLRTCVYCVIETTPMKKAWPTELTTKTD